MNESIIFKPVARQQAVSLVKIILYSWLLIATIDIVVAIAQTLIYGGKPLKMLQFVASGVFGKQSFSGGVSFAIYGLVLHYFISFIWTFLFFKSYRKLKLLSKNRILIGFVYGIFVWVIMNIIVIPISNTPPFKFNLVKAIISLLIIIVAIGIPLAFIANKFFSRGEAVRNVSDEPIDK